MGVDMKVAPGNLKPNTTSTLKEALHKKTENDRKIVVIKVGTSSLLRKGYLHLSLLGQLAETCADLHRAGCRVIVVTSGAVGAGCQVLNNAVRARQSRQSRRKSSRKPLFRQIRGSVG